MDELRVVRREDQCLIVANEAGEEFRLVIDASALSELRHLGRQPNNGPKVSPRLIQSLVRAGKTREEIAKQTGAEESDIERYEEPVLAERRFILTSAQAVAVRTSPAEQSEQQFGAVIAERLIALNAKNIEWSSWRDDEAGWMIGLDFESYDVTHRAIWSFDHRKNLLAPITADATSLSKQGDVGDRLIPKLRVVDSDEQTGRFDSGAFDHESLSRTPDESEEALPARDSAATAEDTPSQVSPAVEAAMKARHPSTGSIPIIDPNAEFVRRREIDSRAIKTTDAQLPDLGQTADLLDALRKRRGEREESLDASDVHEPKNTDAELFDDSDGHETRSSFAAPRLVEPIDESTNEDAATEPAAHRDETLAQPETSKRKGRTPIPSWDDILFGTRSEED